VTRQRHRQSDQTTTKSLKPGPEYLPNQSKGNHYFGEGRGIVLIARKCLFGRSTGLKQPPEEKKGGGKSVGRERRRDRVKERMLMPSDGQARRIRPMRLAKE